MSKALEFLQQHLTRVKLEHAEREASLVRRLEQSEEEQARLRDELDVAGDELELCWAHVEQLKLENTTKHQIEERDDWRALVSSVQEDRTRLQRENARLRDEIRRLGGSLPAEGPDVSQPSDARTRSPSPAVPAAPRSPQPRSGTPSSSYAVTATPRRRQIRLPKPGFVRPGVQTGFLERFFFGKKRRRDHSLNPVLAV